MERRRASRRARRELHLARAWWVVFALVVVLSRLSFEARAGDVFQIYRAAALRWNASQPLYDGAFLYLPTCAMGFGPWTALPFALGGALWRVFNLAAFGCGLWHLCSLHPRERRARTFLVASIATTLLSWSAARHGQMTLAMAGATMLAYGELARGRLRSCAALLGLGVALKPVGIVFLPLAAVLERRLVLPLGVALTCALLLPFAAQDAGYVLEQYSAVPPMLARHAELQGARITPDALSALGLLGLELSRDAALVLRASAALFTTLACLAAAALYGLRGAAPWVMTLVPCALLLALPSTENNTYALMAPGMGLLAARALEHGRLQTVFALAGATLMCLSSYALRQAFPAQLPAMAKPLAALLVLLCATLELARELRGVLRRHRARQVFGGAT